MKPQPLKEDRFGDFMRGDIVQFNRAYSVLIGIVVEPASMQGDEQVHVRWLSPSRLVWAATGTLAYFPHKLRRYDEAL